MYTEEYREITNNSTKEAASKFLHKIVQDNIGELKKLFTAEVVESYDDKELSWMLFVDGCSLTYYMDNVETQCKA